MPDIRSFVFSVKVTVQIACLTAKEIPTKLAMAVNPQLRDVVNNAIHFKESPTYHKHVNGRHRWHQTIAPLRRQLYRGKSCNHAEI